MAENRNDKQDLIASLLMTGLIVFFALLCVAFGVFKGYDWAEREVWKDAIKNKVARHNPTTGRHEWVTNNGGEDGN